MVFKETQLVHQMAERNYGNFDGNIDPYYAMAKKHLNKKILEFRRQR